SSVVHPARHIVSETLGVRLSVTIHLVETGAPGAPMTRLENVVTPGIRIGIESVQMESTLNTDAGGVETLSDAVTPWLASGSHSAYPLGAEGLKVTVALPA